MDEEARKRLNLVRRCRTGMRAAIALALLCSSTIIFGVESQISIPSAGSHDELAMKGKHLRADVDAKYKELRTKKALARDNDITPIVLKYVSPSMSIEDVTSVLRSAGFGEPGVTVDGHLFFSMPVRRGWFSSEDVGVDVAPKAPGDFHVIKSVTGALFSVDI